MNITITGTDAPPRSGVVATLLAKACKVGGVVRGDTVSTFASVADGIGSWELELPPLLGIVGQAPWAYVVTQADGQVWIIDPTAAVSPVVVSDPAIAVALDACPVVPQPGSPASLLSTDAGQTLTTGTDGGILSRAAGAGGGGTSTWSDNGSGNAADVLPVLVGASAATDTPMQVEAAFTAPATANFGNSVIHAVGSGANAGIVAGMEVDLSAGANTIAAGGFHLITGSSPTAQLYGFYDSISDGGQGVGGAAAYVSQVDISGPAPGATVQGVQVIIGAPGGCALLSGLTAVVSGVANESRGVYISSQPAPGTVDAYGLRLNHVAGVAAGADWLLRAETSGAGAKSAFDGSLGLGQQGFPPDFAGAAGQPVLAMRDAVPPTSTPNGGGVLFSEGGALKWLGSSGTVTTIAPA